MKKSEALTTLGLKDGATEEEIKKAHRKLIIENHPDKFGQDKEAREKAEEKTKLINEARDVLISGKWDPEYSTAGTPYGAPFSYNPYNSPYSQSGQPQQNPFAGWPFAETFVWTTWDSTGKKTTYTSSAGTGANPFADWNPFYGTNTQQGSKNTTSSADSTKTTPNPFAGAGNPFAGSASPFAGTIFDSFFKQPPTKEELLQEAKRNLQFDGKFLAIKLVILAVCFLLNWPATGLYLYTIISIGQGLWKRLGILELFFIVPFAMLALIFTPGANATIGIIGALTFVCAVSFDISNVYRHIKAIKTLKKDS